MILRRRPLVAVCALLLVIAGAAWGQYRRALPKGPRAIGVIEWDAKGKARLVPVSIMIDGRWYDAGLYRATPVPMALDRETVYEATQNGAPAGLFTITDVAQLNGSWFARGRWHEGVASPKKADSDAVDLSKPKTAASEDDGRPVLRRPGAQPETPPPAKPEPPAAQKPEPPALPPPAKSADEDDVDRPVLRRGRPQEEQADTVPGNVTGASSGKLKANAGTVQFGEPKRVLVAVSDAKHNDYRSFEFPWKLDEQKKLTTQMTQLAAAQLQAYAQRHPGPLPAQLQDVQVRCFDLDSLNEPELVLTARAGEAAPAPAASSPQARRRGKAATAPSASSQTAPASSQTAPNGGEFYVTVVARQDYNGDLHSIFSMITDDHHLDVYPRLQLIDAVDADGNGRGELLFRQITDQGRSFIIYRVGGDQLSTLYDSTARME